jgi:hypothetical protein
MGRGRPASIWRGPIGYKFVEAVALAKYNHPRSITTGQAIRIVLQQPEFAPLKKYANRYGRCSTRYLEKQLIDAAGFWRMHLPISFRELIGPTSRIYWNRKPRIIGTENELLEHFLRILLFRC